ncbi:MAG: ATP-binding protein [Thermotogota bacterium]|nr:ATP-binding protein [Thermotogota bacterium]
MNIQDLGITNPWWRDRRAIETDRHIARYESFEFRFYPESLRKEIVFNEFGIYTLRGPRQVGKTTFLKLLIKELLNKKTNPHNILFLNAEGLNDRHELTSTLIEYLNLSLDTNEMKYIFIDEITSIIDWQLSIKYLVDSGYLDSCVAILTGSSAIDLKYSSERLPGRKGKGKDLVMFPLSFREYLLTSKSEVPKFTISEIMDLSERDTKKLIFELSFLQSKFQKYLISGGFPLSINDFLSYGKISEDTIRTYSDFMLGEISKHTEKLNMLQLLKKLPDIFAQRFSWNSLLEYVSGPESVDTIKSYFENLSYSFVFSILYFYDFTKGKIKPRKQKKIFPIDPIIFEIVSFHSSRIIDQSKVVEAIVLRHLISSRSLNTGLNLIDGPYYWYSNKGKEIDFLHINDGVTVPVEVKYQNSISRSDYITMKRVFGEGIILTKKDVFEDNGIIGIPVWLFCAICGLR